MIFTHQVEDIEFTYKTSKRRTASLFVERDGSVHLIIPDHLPVSRIEDIINSKRMWIYKSLAEWEDLNASRVERDFTSGEGFLYMGRTYRLKVTDDILENFTFRDNQFLIRKGELKDCEEYFKEFYKHKALQKIPERVQLYAGKMGVKPKSIKVLELGNRWASCSPDGNLNFHWKCMMAPLSVLDYIIVHELAHLIHMNHTDAFWNEVDKVVPDYRSKAEWLKFNGAAMDI
jgi:predicted metal-dependent hydrolase